MKNISLKGFIDTKPGTEELNHVEMICTIVHQLTRNLTVEQIKEQGFADYYVDHTTGLYPATTDDSLTDVQVCQPYRYNRVRQTQSMQIPENGFAEKWNTLRGYPLPGRERH